MNSLKQEHINRLATVINIPAQAWTRGIGEPFPDAIHPYVTYPMIDDGPFNGAPLGGMGAGSIGRTFQGDFARWHLNIGKHHYEPLPACMFSVFMQRGDQRVAQALYTGAPDHDLSAWQWNYPVGAGRYHALFPRSWFVYEADMFPAQLAVEQFSPIIPHNYRDSSLPVAIFNWTAHNPTSEPIKIGLMFTWQNLLGVGFSKDSGGGQTHESRTVSMPEGAVRGVLMTHSGAQPINAWSGSMAIAALEVPGTRVTYRSRFNVNEDGADIWADFAGDGALDNLDDRSASPKGEVPGAGVAVTFTLAPGETLTVPFVLAWDMPVMTFGGAAEAGANVIATKTRQTNWYKRYTAFYGRNGHRAFDLACDALAERATWRQAIINWQAPILADPKRPDWYKTALFNELYFLVDGATAWEHGRVGSPLPATDYMGGFLYMECLDYGFYCTFDVDWYASFALLELFPEIEKRVILDFAETVGEDYPEERNVMATQGIAPRKKAGAIPHDLGGPDEMPWDLPNYYVWQDSNRWKDLNPKFVLRLYRDSVLLQDRSLVTLGWAAAQQAMTYLDAFDHDGDGIPENEGIPDQTYDTWSATGVSAYSGSLWLGALAAMREMARMIGDAQTAAEYNGRLRRATAAFEGALWNGVYYNYDSSGSEYHNSVMADMLAGQWYVDYLGLKLLPDERVGSSLRTIYRLNVQEYGDGQLGAVNGMRPDGSVDRSDMQSEEMWAGTAYGLAAFMLLRGLDAEAFSTAHGVYRLTYETGGMWFRTPEAFAHEGRSYRASTYMRPLAVWAMETALRLRK